MYLDVRPYKEILAGIEAALLIDEGIVKITGAAGTGKTELAYQLSAALQQRGRQVVFFLQAPAHPAELQTGILRQLHLQEKGNFTRRLTDYLLSLPAEKQLLYVMIDNAQQMDELTFNAVRMLCNIQNQAHSLVRVVLLGLPHLNDMMGQPSMRSFAQHLSHSFQLQPMQNEQLKNFCWAYWRERGVERAPPDDKWINDLLKISGGLPGAVLAELGDEEHSNEINISARIQQVVAEEQQAQQTAPAATATSSSKALALSAIVFVLLGGATFLGYQHYGAPTSQSASSVPSAPTTSSSAAVALPAAPAAQTNSLAAVTPATAAVTSATATTPISPAAQPAIVIASNEPTLSPEAEQNIIAEAEAVRLLNMWVQNWQAQNLPGYLGAYSDAFMPESFPSRSAWEAERRRIISAARDVSVSWRELQIRSRNERNMTIEFWLDYSSSTYADRTLKELTLGFEDGRAVILRERNLTVQP